MTIYICHIYTTSTIRKIHLSIHVLWCFPSESLIFFKYKPFFSEMGSGTWSSTSFEAHVNLVKKKFEILKFQRGADLTYPLPPSLPASAIVTLVRITLQ